ncbi:hypothetical protein [Alkalicoccus luteus]|uniref:hypothetical protein n=1 Tax=Alkalicoccus luteus TaxID=1237094 RepID=UPI004033799B
MKKVLLLSTIALLAACQETDTESADAETNEQENEREEQNESVEEEPEEADPAEELDGVWFDEEEKLYVVVDAMEQTTVLANDSDTVETTIESWDSTTVELEDVDPFFEEEEIDWERNEEILTLQQNRTVYLLEKASLNSYLSFLDEAEEETDNEPEDNSEQEEVNEEESEPEVEEEPEPEINWTTYTNDRFGFSVSYPAEWNPGEAPTNDDGLTLYEQDGNTVSVYASYAAGSFAEGETSSVTIQSGETAEQAMLREGGRVTYTAEVVVHDIMYTVYANVSDTFYAEIEQVLEDMTRSMEVWGEAQAEEPAAYEGSFLTAENGVYQLGGVGLGAGAKSVKDIGGPPLEEHMDYDYDGSLVLAYLDREYYIQPETVHSMTGFVSRSDADSLIASLPGEVYVNAPEYNDMSDMLAAIYQPSTTEVAIFRDRGSDIDIFITYADGNFYYAIEEGTYVLND